MKRGITDITNPKRGSFDIQKVYRGSTLVFSREVEDAFYDTFKTNINTGFLKNKQTYSTTLNTVF